jgi:hypothetical protein
VAFKKPKRGKLTAVQQQVNNAHNRVCAIGERGNSLLKMAFKALCNVSLNPWRIGSHRRRRAGIAALRPHPHHMTTLNLDPPMRAA